ncbi:hypothetical protein [Embleya sp. NPDC005971]|uniref:hypothetical protein n=1 Tax=Embleya sp. NPDC005971 TaxID=3156724 RepID=UPI0033D99DC7
MVLGSMILAAALQEDDQAPTVRVETVLGGVMFAAMSLFRRGRATQLAVGRPAVVGWSPSASYHSILLLGSPAR